MQLTIEARAERLLSALAGVVSARAVADESGRLCEIHILASPDLHPKQIVRNVESALSAGLSIIVDRRIISVAQLRASAAPPARKNAQQAEADKNARPVYVRYDAQSTSSLDASCTVTLTRAGSEVVGTSTGLNTQQGRADAAARAVFDALQQDGDAVGMEGTSIVEMHGKSFVLVSARHVSGRNARVLTGVAALLRSPEEAAILAALQATNRLAAL